MANGHTLTAVSLCVTARIPALLIGPPGVGKTSGIEQMADQLNVPLWTVIGSVSDPTDVGGMVLVNEKGIEVAGQALASTDKAPPRWAIEALSAATVAPEDKLAGIVFLDEISTSPPAVQAALLRTLIESRDGKHYVGDLGVPRNIAWLGAMNPPDQAAGGWDLAPPLANRFCHLQWEVDAGHWAEGYMNSWPALTLPRVPDKWTNEIGAAKALVTSYIQTRQDALLRLPEHEEQRGGAWPSPRSWDYTTRLMAATTASGAGNAVRNLLIEGCIGVGAAREFLAWLKALDLPKPADVLADPDKAPIPTRGDQVLAVAASIAAYVLNDGGKTPWEACWQYFERLADAFGEDAVMPAARQLAQGPIPAGATLPGTLTRLSSVLAEIRSLAAKRGGKA